MKKKHILFLFPGGGGIPIGGHKVVYEYANRLAVDNYEVGVVYPAYCFQFNQSFLIILKQFCKAILRYFYNGVLKRYSCRSWFNLDKRVKEHWVFSLNECFVSDADVYVATGVQTSVYLNRYKRISNKNKYYLIQGFENWNHVKDSQVIDTYCYPLNKIVVAHWLEDIIHTNNETCNYIPNGFDYNYFKCLISPENKDKFRICMLYHVSKEKGSADGFSALNIVKKRYPQLQVNIFGVSPRPSDLPDWYHYFQKPEKNVHNRLYNESAIFIGTSWSEGWGLTVGEAMICGCAVACTDNLGYLEMAINNVTALVSPIKDVDSLAANIIRLIENDDLRYRIAKAGRQNIQQFNWDSSYKKLIEVIK